MLVPFVPDRPARRHRLFDRRYALELLAVDVQEKWGVEMSNMHPFGIQEAIAFRDETAQRILANLAVNNPNSMSEWEMCAHAYRLADQLLQARKNQPPPYI